MVHLQQQAPIIQPEKDVILKDTVEIVKYDDVIRKYKIVEHCITKYYLI